MKKLAVAALVAYSTSAGAFGTSEVYKFGDQSYTFSTDIQIAGDYAVTAWGLAYYQGIWRSGNGYLQQCAVSSVAAQLSNVDGSPVIDGDGNPVTSLPIQLTNTPVPMTMHTTIHIMEDRWLGSVEAQVGQQVQVTVNLHCTQSEYSGNGVLLAGPNAGEGGFSIGLNLMQ